MQRDRRALQTFALGALLCSFAPFRASAITDWPVLWDDIEVVDTGVTALSRATDSIIVHAPSTAPWNNADQWYVVYVKDGDIWLRLRDAGTWADPVQVTSDPADSRDPRVAFHGNKVVLVWEDDRTGHAEVWARTWDGISWGTEVCVTGDDVPSRFPAVAGTNSWTGLVWEEQGLTGRSIRGSSYNGSTWATPIAISQSSAEALQPDISLAVDSWFGGGFYAVAWSDSRHGNRSIYSRTWLGESSFSPEVRMTNLPGDSGNPVVHGGICCGDSPSDAVSVTFENVAPGGVSEVWNVWRDGTSIDAPVRLSPDDGIASERPAMTAFDFYTYVMPHIGEWGVPYPKAYITWEDSAPSCHPFVAKLPYQVTGRVLDPLLASCGSICCSGRFVEFAVG